MTRSDETELPGASDTVPKTVKNILASKPTLQQLKTRTESLRDPHFQPIQYEPRPTTTTTKELHLTEPYQYFDLFVPTEQLSLISTYTNDNASAKRSDQYERQAEPYFYCTDGEVPPPLKARPWTDTSVGEIGVFVGIMLWIGVFKNARMSTFWDPYTDTGHSPDISSVRPLRLRKICGFY